MSEDLQEQIRIIEQFLNANWNEMQEGKEKLLNKLNSFKRAVSKGQSRFEWVDSVLVKAIEKGEWVIFENANLCNPSILDRLNSLLEEGNHTLSINEQGLVEGDLLREVKAHAEFRPIFLINKKTLFDQGRDVSRALRNRCLLIDIQYQVDNADSSSSSNTL
jgi:midasin